MNPRWSKHTRIFVLTFFIVLLAFLSNTVHAGAIEYILNNPAGYEFSPQSVEASWEDVGENSSSGGGISNNNNDSDLPSMTFAPDGSLFIAWEDYSGGDGEIYVRRWNGNSWNQVGSNSAQSGGISNNSGTSRRPSLDITPGGTPYIAWDDNSNGDYEIYVKTWNGSSWTEVGSISASGGGISNNSGDSMSPKLVVDNNGIPYVCWIDDSSGNWEIYIRRWNNSYWEEVGSNSASGGGISNNSGVSRSCTLAIGSNNRPVVAWRDNTSGDYEIYARQWNGSSWSLIGNSSASGGGISNNSGISGNPRMINGDGNMLYLGWHDSSPGNYEIYLRRWNGSSWVEVGNSARGGGISSNSSKSTATSPAYSANGNLYVAWHDEPSSGDVEIFVRRWNGSSWVEVGNNSASGGGISNNSGDSTKPHLIFSPSGIPYIAWSDGSAGDTEIYVKRWSEGVNCYNLNLTHTGNGSDPMAFPSKSLDCNNGQYVSGENIDLEAYPSNGWYVSSWTGTSNDNSNSLFNTVTMPSSDHTVVANYEEEQQYYSLTVNVNGNGSVVINPDQTSYVQGTTVELTAQPGGGWAFSGWSGDLNGNTNPTLLSMNGDKSVTANFEQTADTTAPAIIDDLEAVPGDSVGSIKLSWTAPGDDGTSGRASRYVVRRSNSRIISSNWGSATDISGEPQPDNSGSRQTMTVKGLAEGRRYYFAIRAEDEAGNMGGISNSPDATTPTIHKIHLPNLLASFTNYWDGNREREPNDKYNLANGVLRSGITYFGSFSDANDIDDYYHFTSNNSGLVEITLKNIPYGQDYDLVLRNEFLSAVGFSGNHENSDELISVNLSSGLYYIQVNNDIKKAHTDSYSLKVIYP